MTTSIEVERLCKAFGSTVAVDEVSLSVPEGSVVGLLGPTGAGKTTLINCLTTLIRPDSGRASVAGFDVVNQPGLVRANTAVTGQFAAIDDMLTGRENLVLFARLLKLPRASAVARAEELLKRFDLSDTADKRVSAYSGGMRRRLDLAVSLVVERPVIFLDEPTTGLDPRSREALWQVVRDQRNEGTTILLTTQYLEEADQLADRIVVIDHGRIIASGTSSELKERVGGGSVCEIHIAEAGLRRRAASALAGISPAIAVEDGSITLPATGTGVLAEVVRRLDAEDIEPDDVGLRRPTLDDVFFTLTGSRTST